MYRWVLFFGSLLYWISVCTIIFKNLTISWTFNLDGTQKISSNTSYKIILLDLETQQHHTIKQIHIHSPFKYLGSERTPLGTTRHQVLSNKKHTLRGARIISSSNMNRFHIILYLKTHLHPKQNISSSLYLPQFQTIFLYLELKDQSSTIYHKLQSYLASCSSLWWSQIL